jgi:hypothetical protein
MARALAAHNRDEDDDTLPDLDHPLLEVLEGGLPTPADLFES